MATHCYLLIAPRQMGKIPQGFHLQVPSDVSPSPNVKDVEEALKRAGFNDTQSLSYRSPGNWKCQKL